MTTVYDFEGVTLSHSSGLTLDLVNIPLNSMVALLQRGLTHYLSNEVSSKINSKIKKDIVGASDRKLADVTKEEVAAFRMAHPSLVKQWTDDERPAALEEIKTGKAAGTDGRSAPRKARKSRFDVILGEIVWESAVNWLIARKLARRDVANHLKVLAIVDGKSTTLKEATVFAGLRIPAIDSEGNRLDGQETDPTMARLLERQLLLKGNQLRALAEERYEEEKARLAESEEADEVDEEDLDG